MPMFKKKPVEIEAVQYDGTAASLAEILHFAHRDLSPAAQRVVWHDGYCIYVRTLEGDMTASPGDWIIRGVKGEFYPCKPDIFAATYEPCDR
jgi:hypothetical protein